VPANTRRSLAKVPHDAGLRLAAKAALTYPPVRFTAPQLQCIGRAIGEDVRRYELPVYAAALMPDHAHMVIARKAQHAEDWIGYFKRAASRLLRAEGLHPFGDREQPGGRLPTPWVDGGWKVYLHTPEEIRTRIGYVERNPVEAGMPPQRWDFVTPYAP